MTITRPLPGPTVADHPDSVKARRSHAGEDMAIFVATYEPDASTERHAEIERHFSDALRAASADAAEELHRALEREERA